MKNSFNKIGIIYNRDIPDSCNLAKKLQEKLSNSISFCVNEMNKNINLAIVIGGDGTFLKASRFYAPYSIPILGFNVGRLGYLAQARPEEINDVIEKLKNNDFIIENRLMLKANKKTALNDVVIKGVNCARSSTMELYINDKKLCSYIADGLIISTPTGSTAYSLSAGGPVVSPDIDCFLIIPICPHTLNMRPIVIPSNEKITIKNKNEKLNVSFDGQVDIIVENEITIEKNDYFAKLLVLNQNKDKFYDILKEKLHWSLSPRK
ncbi:MAG: NAD(+)/NADH kinase [Candidatus Gastranaerophilales bacterium]|nr:NAD(+)/NADH kinase [Candidatus Gastranaerophilales bacterium]